MARLYSFHFASKTPCNDAMVENELVRLEKFINSFSYPIVAGHSLGAWWTANLVVRQKAKIRKAVFFTPLSDVKRYPHIFNCDSQYNPLNTIVPMDNYGPNKNLVFTGNKDYITLENNGKQLAIHFNSSEYKLYGGHFYQRNHNNALEFMKRWIEIE